MYVDERVGDKPNEIERERDREIKREEEVRSVGKMETCNIREMRVHLDSVHVEGEETAGLMRELENMDERGRISWVEGLIILCGRERDW